MATANIVFSYPGFVPQHLLALRKAENMVTNA